MATLNSKENPLIGLNGSQLKRGRCYPGIKLSGGTEDFCELNSNQEENGNGTNGEAENGLTSKLEDNNYQDSQNNTDKYYLNNGNSERYSHNPSYSVYNDLGRPAGLSTDRCIRDFMSAKYKKYHWKQPKMTNKESNDSDSISNNSSRPSDKDTTSGKRDEGDVKDIVKSNYVMRRENRMRNMSHSDIFGAGDTGSKRRLNHGTDSNGVTSSDYNRSITGNSHTHYSRYNYNYLGNKRLKSNEFNHTNSENKSDTLGRTSSRSDTTDPGTDASFNKNSAEDNCLNVLCLSGLKSDASEELLINFCESCKLKVLSVHLDRNILTHTCTGKATVKVWSSRDDLAPLKDLLRENGYKFQIK